MDAIAVWLGKFIGEAIKPTLKEVIHEVFEERAAMGKPNPDLQRITDALADPLGLFTPRTPEGNHHAGGDGGGAGKGG